MLISCEGLTARILIFRSKQLRMLISRQGLMARLLIWLKNEQNLHFTQHVSSKPSIWGQNSLECWFHVKAWQQGCWFDLKTNKNFISCWFYVKAPDGKAVEFHLKTSKSSFHAARKLKTSISGQNRLEYVFHMNAWEQGCWFHLGNNKMLTTCNVRISSKM